MSEEARPLTQGNGLTIEDFRFAIETAFVSCFRRETQYRSQAAKQRKRVARGERSEPLEEKGAQRALKGRKKTIAKQGLSPLPGLGPKNEFCERNRLMPRIQRGTLFMK
jgi:hypothetical protein